MSFAGLDIQIWNDELDVMRPIIEDAGYEFLSNDPGWDIQTQVADVESWILRGDDGTVTVTAVVTPDGTRELEVQGTAWLEVDQEARAMRWGSERHSYRGSLTVESDVEGDIDNIMDADTTAVKFGDGKVTDSALKKVDGIRLAVVTWLVNDPPDGQEDDAELAVALLDDGDGFQICKIDGSDGDSANETMSNFETDYESDCEYSK